MEDNLEWLSSLLVKSGPAARGTSVGKLELMPLDVPLKCLVLNLKDEGQVKENYSSYEGELDVQSLYIGFILGLAGSVMNSCLGHNMY